MRSPSRTLLTMVAIQAILVLGIALACSASGSIGANAKPVAILYLQRTPEASEIAARTTRAKYEPPSGCLLGGYIEFDKTLNRRVLDFDRVSRRDPAQFESRVGRPHAMYFFYVGYGRPLPIGWIRWLAVHGKFVHIALEPNDGLNMVRDDAYLRRIADELAASRAKVFLRFGSEMNGEWTNYHSPKQFKEKFRLVHAAMRKRAPNVAMVWCPYATPVRVIPEYYPGDDATDWVGVNMYSVIYHNNKLNARCETEHPNDLLNAVYSRYAKRKPMMICEFAATHYSECDRKWRPDFAALKIGTLYRALPRLYPRVKAINYFDLSSSAVHNDYSVTDDDTVLEAYKRSTAPEYFISDANDIPKAARAKAPMKIRSGEILKGDIQLSCFARGPSDHVTVQYTVDGVVIYRAAHPIDWPCFWNASGAKPGKHVLGLKVLDARNRTVASQTVPVVTVR